MILSNDWQLSWRDQIINYLRANTTLNDPQEARRIKREAAKYVLITSQLYKQGEAKAERAIKEVHEGACRSHIGGRALASKIPCVRFYWSTLKRDNLEFIKKCDKCQRYVDQYQAPPKQLHSMTLPWPFYMWGVDILGPFPLAPMDYFTKWIEVEPVSMITIEKVKLPIVIVSDNGTQFAVRVVADFCAQYGINQSFTLVGHPQSNGQAEAANRVILKGLRKQLEEVKGH
ncbi:Pro-Pol polyprotein, partial [Mucuna pruriens]